jgi:hypothetical protein
MGEMAWFPSAALKPYITWQVVDSTHAMATMSYKGVSASGLFTFNNRGDMVQFDAKRYYDRKEGTALEDWRVTTTGYRSFNGVRIPAQCQITRRLKEGDFTWYKVRLTDIRYNRPTSPITLKPPEN